MHYVYIIENEKGRIYVGESSNVEKRVKSHNQKNGPDWTQGKGPWELIYIEKHGTETEAKKREKYLKSLKAGQRIKTILGISG